MTGREKFEAWFAPKKAEMMRNKIPMLAIIREHQRDLATWQAALASQQPVAAKEGFNLGHCTHEPDFTRSGMICTSDEQAAHQPADDGWIEWAGGECPVGPEDAVEVKCKNGDTYKGWAPETYGWEHFGLQHDVIAYRVVKS